jgi:hypothetical protein
MSAPEIFAWATAIALGQMQAADDSARQALLSTMRANAAKERAAVLEQPDDSDSRTPKKRGFVNVGSPGMMVAGLAATTANGTFPTPPAIADQQEQTIAYLTSSLPSSAKVCHTHLFVCASLFLSHTLVAQQVSNVPFIQALPNLNAAPVLETDDNETNNETDLTPAPVTTPAKRTRSQSASTVTAKVSTAAAQARARATASPVPAAPRGPGTAESRPESASTMPALIMLPLVVRCCLLLISAKALTSGRSPLLFRCLLTSCRIATMLSPPSSRRNGLAICRWPLATFSSIPTHRPHDSRRLPASASDRHRPPPLPRRPPSHSHCLRRCLCLRLCLRRRRLAIPLRHRPRRVRHRHRLLLPLLRLPLLRPTPAVCCCSNLTVDRPGVYRHCVYTVVNNEATIAVTLTAVIAVEEKSVGMTKDVVVCIQRHSSILQSQDKVADIERPGRAAWCPMARENLHQTRICMTDGDVP